MRPTDDDIRRRLDSRTKPPGSLGRLEDLAARICRIQGTLSPRTTPRRLVLFAADHGVAASGVSTWPSSVTALMVRNIIAGGAASSVLARTFACDVRVVDVGVDADIGESSGNFVNAKIRRGSRDLSREPALTPDEFRAAWDVGAGEARSAMADGCAVALVGEMGIGNTTAAACVTSLLTGSTVAETVGPGAGATAATMAAKRAAVDTALTRAGSATSTEWAVASLSGLEIAAMAGFFAAAAEEDLPVVLDGYIATAGAMIAEALSPNTARSLIAAHRSAEPGHTAALRYLRLTPFLDGWNLRLGEGTGALLLLPLLDAAAAVARDMAGFDDLGIDPS